MTLIRNGNCASVLPLSSLDSFPSEGKVKMSYSKLCSDFGKSDTVVNAAIIVLISVALDNMTFLYYLYCIKNILHNIINILKFLFN